MFDIPKIKYEGPKSKNPFSFKFYNPDENIGGKPMKEQLRFAMSWWHTLCGEGADMFGRGTADKSFGGTNPMEIYKNKANSITSILYIHLNKFLKCHRNL